MYQSDQRWQNFVVPQTGATATTTNSNVIGVLEGEGIGPEIMQVTIKLLQALESCGSHRFSLRYGGKIGMDAITHQGKPLPEEVIDFCRQVFAVQGAVLNGPGGDRYVYDLRKKFDLYCKIVPLRPIPVLYGANRLKFDRLDEIDILLIRENVGGIYQGSGSITINDRGERQAEHTFSYSEYEVRRIVTVAARIAEQRRGKMTVVIKDGGIPAISTLWRDIAREVADEQNIQVLFMNVDLAAYLLIQEPHKFDVIVTPNLFGDVLADLGAVIQGGRGISYSGNFSSEGAAVYQTNHGAAYELTGQDSANPVGQIFSLAMLLRESFGLTHTACMIEKAVEEVWRQGWRTVDLIEPGCRQAGTIDMGNLICETILRLHREDMASVAGTHTH